MAQAEINDLENELKNIYYNISNPASYRGITPLFNEINRIRAEAGRVKVPRTVVVNWLQKQDAYSTIKDSPVQFPRNPYKIPKLESQLGGDLIDLNAYAKENDGNKWILVVMNLYSRFVWTEPAKS